MNVALRAVHDALRRNPADRWRVFIAALLDRVGPGALVEASEIQAHLRSLELGGTAGEWAANLRLLRVLSPEGRLDAARAESVGTALELAADSFDSPKSAPSWAPVATVPSELRALLHSPPLRQTAGVLLELIDHAKVEVRLAAPFIDPAAVEFLTDSLMAAGRNGVHVSVVTSTGQAVHLADLARLWSANGRARLQVTEIQTQVSPLGSHAKAMVVDSERGYIGSANLTAAGLGRHIELGVQLAGSQLAELTGVLVALERVGMRVFAVGGDPPARGSSVRAIASA
jgi:hypothetical protein